MPLAGRFQFALTSGPWYLAVQAGGNSNVRFRLRMDTGSISNLSLNGGSYTNQSLVAGDWIYYSAFIPTNAPVNWMVTSAVQLGHVVMYVRDTSPPGQATSTTDLRDWNADYKNAGPYPNSPPPEPTPDHAALAAAGHLLFGLRGPGRFHFLGELRDQWRRHQLHQRHSLLQRLHQHQPARLRPDKYRIDVPPGADRWIHFSTNSSAVYLYLEQGSVPTMTTSDNWDSYGYYTSLNQYLGNSSQWPWLPGYSYFLAVTNTSASAQPFSFVLNGEGPGGAPFEFASVQDSSSHYGQLSMTVTPGWQPTPWKPPPI